MKPRADKAALGNPAGRPRGSRNRAILNEEFIAALLRHFRREGERAIARMAKSQPAAYCKILTLLVPRELKLEHSNVVADLSDEQLAAMIAEFEERIAAKATGLDAKVITHEESPALPAPKRKRANLILEAADTAIAPTTARYRNPNERIQMRQDARIVYDSNRGREGNRILLRLSCRNRSDSRTSLSNSQIAGPSA